MKIKIVNVLVQFEVEGGDEAQQNALDDFIEEQESGDDSDNPVYEGVNKVVKAVMLNAPHLHLKDNDFDIEITMRVVEK